MRDTTITELTEILRLLAQEGGKREITSIEPNAEIIDHDPSDKLPAGYILVQDKTGHRMPAVKVAGMTYSTGDKVNLIKIKGTEPIAFGAGSGSPSTGLPIHDHSSGTTGGPNLREIEELEFDDATTLTIDGAGAVTRVQVYHAIDTFGGGATDNLDTINGGVQGDLLIIRAANDARTVVVKHNVGNIWLLGSADISLEDTEDHLAFIYDGTMWCSIGDGGGAGGGGWPFNIKTVDATDADADYASLDVAIATEPAATWFHIGRGQFATSAAASERYTYIGEGWDTDDVLDDYIGYWDTGATVLGFSPISDSQFFRCKIYAYAESTDAAQAIVGTDDTFYHQCYLYAHASGSGWAYGIAVGTDLYIMGGRIRAQTDGAGTAIGINATAGANVYLMGFPMIEADAGWEVVGAGNVYGCWVNAAGELWQCDGVANDRVRRLGWEAGSATAYTIDAGGAILPEAVWCKVETNGLAATDNLDTITATNKNAGSVIYISPNNSARTVVVRHGVGNIWIPGGADISLEDAEHFLLLIYDGTNWCVVGSGGGGYPFDTKELTVDPSDPDAQFTTVALAAAAAAAGDCIRVGAGTHTVNAVDIPLGVDLRGSGKDITILQTSTVVECVNFQGSDVCSDLTIQNTYDTASSIYAVKFEGADVTCEHVHAIATNATGSSYAWNPRSTTCVLKDCDGTASGPADHGAVSTFGGNVVLTIEGGTYDGTDNDISAGTAGDIITLNNPIAANGTIDATGTVQGEWVDAAGNTHLRGFAAADSYSVAVKNTSGVTAVAGDVGYIDGAGEYKETTTAYYSGAWCVVLVGGANNADIYVARRGRVIITLNGNCSIGDFIYTSTTAGQGQPLAYMRSEVLAVALTANSGGAGGTCTALLLTGTQRILQTSSNDICRVETHSSTDFVSTIATLPDGAVLTYGAVTSGAEDTIEPLAATQLGKIVLANTTRGNDALIDSTVVATNTITLTAAVPGNWVVGDTITARSQTSDTTASPYNFEIDLSSADNTVIPTLARNLVMDVGNSDTGGVGRFSGISPLKTWAGSAEALFYSATAGFQFRQAEVGIINGRFCTRGFASGAATKSTVIRLSGYDLAIP